MKITLKPFFDWLLGRSPLGVVENWTADRAAKAERDTLARLGRLSEPSYTWHPKLLKAFKLQQRRKKATVHEFRKRA